MTSKPEGPGKDARSADTSAQKRPHATLDLKATEIKTADDSATSAKATAERTAAEKSAGGKDAGGGASAGASSLKSETKPSAASEQAKTAAPGAAPSAAPGSKTSADSKTASSPTRPSSAGSFFSHLLASVAGGVVALGGLQYLAPPKPGGDTELVEQARRLEARVLALEQAKDQPVADSALVQKLEEATGRIMRLESLQTSVTQLAEEQARLAQQSVELAGKIGTVPAADTERVAKVEEQLRALAAAAGEEGDKGGRIPQLAAITGRVSDLESRLENQITALRKSMPEEVSGRIGTVAEASEAARTTSQRLDREVQTLKTDVVRLGQRVEALKADDDRTLETLNVLKEEQGRQTSALEALKTGVEQQLKSAAKPADVSAAVAPVSAKLQSLEGNLESVVRSEKERKADAERILVSLELANLKRALEGGQGFAAELAAVRRASGGKVSLALLDKYQTSGLPASTELAREFRAIAHDIIEAASTPASAGVVDRLIAGARNVVRVRKVDHSPDDKSVEAVVARIETALKVGRLGDALEHAKDIPDSASGRASEWRSKVEARHAVDQAIADLENELKASLGAGAAPTPQPAAAPVAPTAPGSN